MINTASSLVGRTWNSGLILFLFLSLSLHSQEQNDPLGFQFSNSPDVAEAGEHSPVLNAGLAAEIGMKPSTEKWAVHVRSRMGRVHTSPELARLKEEKMAQKLASLGTGTQLSKTSTVATPSIGTNFEGNWSVASNPPDNSIAISNGGIIVSANNDGVEYYDQSGQLLFVESWSDFINQPQLTANIFDPVVNYDSGADRFVMVVLHGTNAAASKVLVLFSKTNNPKDGWNLYILNGNPLSDNSWFDYPNLGVSGQEIYVTGNLYDPSDNFNQSIIYQIQKAEGYSGGNLNFQYWSNLNAQPFPAFTLVPTSHGQQGNIGPGMIFVSTRPGGENRVRIWELTNYIGSGPVLNAYIANVNPYSPAGDALMPGTNLTLDNGDCRIKGAFYLNQTAHFVFHGDVGQGWNGIFYSRVQLATLTSQTATLGKVGIEDYSYPVVTSFGTQLTDPTAMIAFLHCSSTIFPSASVVECNANMQWSQPAQIKAGETYIDFLQGNKQRWGDYSGMARKFNGSNPEVWAATCYGTGVTTQGGTMPHTFKTWITKIQAAPVGLEEPILDQKAQFFPNPVRDHIGIDFTMDSKEEISIQIYDSQGRKVKLLYRGVPKVGLNQLTFSKGALASGIYFVSIQSESKLLSYEKVVVED